MLNLVQLESEFTAEINPGNLKDAMKVLGATSGNVWKVPFNELLIIEGFNIRVHNDKYWAKVNEYAESMFNEGYFLHKPMTGLIQRDEAGESRVYIFDGHTRLLAIPIANERLAAVGRPLISDVSVIVPTRKDNKPMSVADLTFAMVNGNKGNTHSAYEYAVACQRLVREGESRTEIARRFGISGEWVNSLLLLMSAPKVLRERVANDALTVTRAVQLLKEHGADAVEMVEDAVTAKVPDGKPLRITKKNIQPASRFDKLVKRSAPKLYSALEDVKMDPAFDSLSVDTREKLLALMEEMQKAKADNSVDHSQQATIFDAKADGETKTAAA